MAKILCAISGIQFSCDHVPMYLQSREAHHPIFNLPTPKLLGLYGKWIKQELTEIDSYLLFLALLDSTELMRWTIPAQRNAHTSSIVANNMSQLVHVIGQIDTIKHPSFALAQISISSETKTLENVKHWIESWSAAIVDFKDGYRLSYALQEKNRKLISRENHLSKLIKDQSRDPVEYARIVAQWAAVAGEFPENGTTPNPLTGTRTSISDYWKDIITYCLKEEKMFSIPATDIHELIEHCEDNIDHGSIYAHTLMSILRTSIKKQKDFFGLGDFNLPAGPMFRILDGNANIEDANKLSMIAAAPTSEPRKEQYPNLIGYLRAKAKWDMAQAYAAQNPEEKKKDNREGEDGAENGEVLS